LDIGLDAGQEVGASPLLLCQALGTERAHFAIESVHVDRQRPVVLDHDPAADDYRRNVDTHRTLDKGLGNVELRVDPGIARHPVEIDKDRVALHTRAESADLAGKTGRLGAVHGRDLERLVGAQCGCRQFKTV
jgi:hypothetical protein